MSPVGHFRTPDEWQALKWLTDSLRPKCQSLPPPAIPAKLKGQTTLKAVIRNALQVYLDTWNLWKISVGCTNFLDVKRTFKLTGLTLP